VQDVARNVAPASKARKHLPVVPSADDVQSSLAADGRRRFVYPADVRGRFVTRRRAIFAALVAVWLALPLVKIGGHPALFLDVATRQFYLFGATFNAQDAWLLVFVVTGIVFALALTTALFGRVFCGYACPQTVFLEGLFRPIERLVEGPREKRMRRDHGPLTFDKVWRKVVKHTLFFGAAAFVAHVMLSFFVSVPATLAMVRGNPADHPEAFAWATAVTLVLYGNFAWFREQVCLIVCPYGRLQSTLLDDDTWVIGYDEKRGEPRGKVHDTGAGDCIDCKRCVAVCPTGIDIRNGLQLDCIGCTACIDACDEIMDKVERPRGLIRYDSLTGFAGKKRRILRPRLAAYAALGLLGTGAAAFAFSGRTSFEANLLRERGAPFVIDGDEVRNSYALHIVNKRAEPQTFELELEAPHGFELSIAKSKIELGPMEDARVNVVVRAPRGTADREIGIEVESSTGEEREAKARFVGGN
jgi:cytochrome c oxidase accessory protein FixG